MEYLLNQAAAPVVEGTAASGFDAGVCHGACARGARGFTLFEMIIVLAIAAILAAMAIPAMRTFLQNQQAISAATTLISNLNYARSEAIKEDLPAGGGGGVSICASADGINCDPMGNWSNGWIVVSSANAVPLAVNGALQTGMTLSTAPATAAVAFQPNGTSTLPALVEFTFCDSRGAGYAREVEVDLTGRIQAASKPGFDVTGTTALVCP